MRYKHIERARVKIKVLTPLHIGSGVMLRKKEIIYDRKNGVAMIPSLPRMIEYIYTKCRRFTPGAFEAFMMSQWDNDLYKFLRGQNIPLSPTPKWVLYTERVERDAGASVNQLKCFIRDADGRPYIPGSSIKGALRTALLSTKMTDDDATELKTELEDGHSKASAAEDALRELRLNYAKPNDAVNDIMRCVSVSDSAPFTGDAVSICRRMDVSPSGRFRKLSAFNECVLPGSETHFYLTLNGSLCQPSKLLDELKRSLESWQELCYSAYDRHYENIEGLEIVPSQGGLPILLGAGTGFQTKSLIYAADPGEALNAAKSYLNRLPTYKPRVDDVTAPYMLKVTRAGDTLYRMGCCEVVFE